MYIYSSVGHYLSCSTDNKEKLARIKAAILAYYDALDKAALSSDIEEYMLDTGQSKVRTIFRTPESIMKTIATLEAQKTRIENICAGGRYTLRDGNVKMC